MAARFRSKLLRCGADSAAMLLLIDLSMALLLPLTALQPAALGARCATAAPRRLGCAVAMRDAAYDAACEAALPARLAFARRSVLLGGATLLALPASGFARTPGSVDVRESVDQIRDAAAALRKLRQVPPATYPPTHSRTYEILHTLRQVPPAGTIHPRTHAPTRSRAAACTHARLILTTNVYTPHTCYVPLAAAGVVALRSHR